MQHLNVGAVVEMRIVVMIVITTLVIANMAICTGLLEVRCRMRFPHAAGSLCASVGVRPR